MYGAGVELGESYPLPVVSVEESQQLVACACNVIEQSLADTHVKTPFRPRSNMGNVNNVSSGTPATASRSIAQCVSPFLSLHLDPACPLWNLWKRTTRESSI